MKVELEEREWNQIIAAVAAQHPLIAKISSQLVQQKMYPHAGTEAYPQGQHAEEAAAMGARQSVGGIAGAAYGASDPNGKWSSEKAREK
jgi:hypothetical protein